MARWRDLDPAHLWVVGPALFTFILAGYLLSFNVDKPTHNADWFIRYQVACSIVERNALDIRPIVMMGAPARACVATITRSIRSARPRPLSRSTCWGASWPAWRTRTAIAASPHPSSS